MASAPSDPIALSFHESLLRLSDVQLLQGPHWLNDQIISFYFEFLEKVKYKTNKDILFVSPEVTQCIKIVPEDEIGIFLSPLDAEKKPFIFFPINDNDTHRAGGSHWSLLVFSRPESAFFHFDSSAATNLPHCHQIVNRTKHFLGKPSALLKSVRCLQQSNSYDCGIHVLCMTDNISDYINRFEVVEGAGSISHETISRKRGDLLKIIAQLGGKIS